MSPAKDFIKKEFTLVIAFIAAALAVYFLRPGVDIIIGSIDFEVLCLLGALMLVVSGFKEIGVIHNGARLLLSKAGSIRTIGLILWVICFFGAMLMTNDVMLLTLVPLTLITLSLCNMQKYSIYFICLQTIAANLGSMLTPMGNPQNLYLYSYYDLGFAEFVKITFPITLASFILLLIFTLFIKNQKLDNSLSLEVVKVDKRLLALYSILTIPCLLGVFKIISSVWVFVGVLVINLIADRKNTSKIDWCLLLTFIMFFIFVDTIKTSPELNDLLQKSVSGKEFGLGIIVSQVISNVPAAFLLSDFANDFKALILGVNVGGLGTIIASLASLISFKLYSISSSKAKPKTYLFIFTVLNLIFLLILIGLCCIMTR